MKEQGQFVPKNEVQLADQVNRVSLAIGENIVPDSQRNSVMSASETDLINTYPFRYSLYVDALRNNPIAPEASARLHALNALDQYIVDHHIGEDTTLRGSQITVFEDLRDHLEKGELEGYIKLPTGAGKTVLFTEFVEATDLQTLIVVPSKILVDQTEDKFKRFAKDMDTGKIYSLKKQFGSQVTITTYQSLLRNLDSGALDASDYELLILDEVHRSLSPRRQEAVKKFEKALKIGFTATPEFSRNKKVQSLLKKEIHSVSIMEAAQEGIVSPFSAMLVRTDVDLSNVSITSSGEYDQEDLERAINIESRNQGAVELYKQMFDGETGVAYCVSVKHANELSRQFNEKGISSCVVSGRQSRQEQHRILDAYKIGDIQMLCNADILIEGFDEPKASVCLNLRPTLSPVIAEQRGGRTLRIDPDNTDKHAYVVDFIDRFRSSRQGPVTFAQIAGGAQVDRTCTVAKINEIEKGDMVYEKAVINIKGLEVIIDPEEVMRVIRETTIQEYDELPDGMMTKDKMKRKYKFSELQFQRTLKSMKKHDNDIEPLKVHVNNMGRTVNVYEKSDALFICIWRIFDNYRYYDDLRSQNLNSAEFLQNDEILNIINNLINDNDQFAELVEDTVQRTNFFRSNDRSANVRTFMNFVEKMKLIYKERKQEEF